MSLSARVHAFFSSVLPTLTSGQDAALQSDQRGCLRVAEQYPPDYEDGVNDVAHVHARAIPSAVGAWARSSSAGTKVGNTIPAVIKASGGRVRRVTMHNYGTTTPTLMVKNKATAIANPDTPDYRRTVAAGTATVPTIATIDFGPEGVWLGTGIAIGASSTVDTFTVMVGNDVHYEIDWI